MSFTASMFGRAIARAFSAPAARIESTYAASAESRLISSRIGRSFSTARSASAFLKAEN